MNNPFPYHTESQGNLSATTEEVFALLDDHRRLSAHMTRRSWRMGWGRMDVALDTMAGQAIGSHIRLFGRVFGIRLELDEVVTEYQPPTRKAWQTVGTPRLLVIGPYRMEFTLIPGLDGRDRRNVRLTVFIDYSLPRAGVPRLLGRLFGHRYARWCTARMVADAASVFPAVS